MAELASVIVKSYFRQFTSGCDCISCDCPDCKSCLSFRHSISSPQEAAVLALAHCRDHQFDRVCPGLTPLIQNPSWAITSQKFDLIVTSLLQPPAGHADLRSIGLELPTLLANQGSFPFIFGGTEILTHADLRLNDDLFASFVRSSTSYSALFTRMVEVVWNNVSVSLIRNPFTDRLWHVRALILIWLFDPRLLFWELPEYVFAIIRRILELPGPAVALFFEALQRLPNHLRHIVSVIVSGLNAHPTQLRPDDRLFFSCAQFLWCLREMVSEPSPTPLPSSAFWVPAYCRLIPIDKAAFWADWPLRRYPAVLTLEFKNRRLRAQLEQRQNAQMQRAFHEQRHDPWLVADNDRLLRGVSFSLTVRRDHLLEDTIRAIRRAPVDHLERRLMVTFDGEEAVDAGGVSREYFHLLIANLFSPDYGMFRLVHGRYYWFTVNPIDDPGVFKTLGTIVALAVYNEIILPIRFPLLFYRKLLKKAIRLKDLAEIDPELVRGWQSLREMRDRGEDVRDVMLRFSITMDNFGTPQEVEVVPGGMEIEVTNDGVDPYIDACVDWYTKTSVEKQFRAFEQGFTPLFGSDRLAIFAPDELDLLVSGEEVFDWEELKKNARYSHGYRPTSKPVKVFWEIFQAMSNKEKAKFLQFTTGSDRVPIGGLSKVIITIQKLNDARMLPISHTCFSIFGLPPYPTKAEMRQKIMIALNETEGFGLR